MGIFSTNTLPDQEKSLKDIEDILMGIGVNTFVKEYDGDNLSGLFFMLHDESHGDIYFKLPLNVSAIIESLKNDYRKVTRKDKFDIRDNAERIALSELVNHVTAVATSIKLKQTTLIESFFAYIYNKETDVTLFKSMNEKDNIKFLP